jgi:hypothetical protein
MRTDFFNHWNPRLREKAEFDEAQHPRSSDGKFSSGGGGFPQVAYKMVERAYDKAKVGHISSVPLHEIYANLSGKAREDFSKIVLDLASRPDPVVHLAAESAPASLTPEQRKGTIERNGKTYTHVLWRNRQEKY